MLPPHWLKAGDYLPSSPVTPGRQSETVLYYSTRPVTVMVLVKWGVHAPCRLLGSTMYVPLQSVLLPSSQASLAPNHSE